VTDGCGLALYFDWLGDRYGQRLCAVIHGSERLLAQSVEGCQSESTGGLQTFQDLSRQRIGEAELIFLVGLSGGDYWSSSVETLASRRGFRWDLSCKPSTPKKLCAAFDLALGARRLDEKTATLPVDDQWECVFECQTVGDSMTQVLLEDSILKTVATCPATRGKSPIRWKLSGELRRIGEGRGEKEAPRELDPC
jgi:hypothetical protein